MDLRARSEPPSEEQVRPPQIPLALRDQRDMALLYRQKGQHRPQRQSRAPRKWGPQKEQLQPLSSAPAVPRRLRAPRTWMGVCVPMRLPCAKSGLIGKDSDAGRDWGQKEKGTTEDEMVGWHHRLDDISLGTQLVKKPPAMQETWVRSLGREDPLGKKMETHTSILAWEIPRTEEPARL